MSLLPIRLVPDPILSQIAVSVEEITSEIIKILDDMRETMYVESGIGLAATQVGVLLRLIVIDVSRGEGESQLYQMINPEIISLSDEKEFYNEGCLSIPGVNREILRPVSGVFSYLDIKGESHELEADHLLARCIQHEIDHLNGILFIDHLSKLRRKMIMKKIIKSFENFEKK